MKHYSGKEVIAILKRDGVRHVTMTEHAETIGVSPTMLCAVLKGKKKPGRKILSWLGLGKKIVYAAIPRPKSVTRMVRD